MTLPVHIKDGTGSNRTAQVTVDRALKVTAGPMTARTYSIDELTRFRVLRKFLTNDALSNDLTIDGSTTAQEFKYRPDNDEVAYIYGIRFILSGTDMELDTNDMMRFGQATAGGTPLTNGILCGVLQSKVMTDLFADPVVTLGDFLSWVDSYMFFRNAVSAQSDYVSFDISFETAVVLTGQKSDEIVVTVQDDLTAIERFEVIARGYYEEIPNGEI